MLTKFRKIRAMDLGIFLLGLLEGAPRSPGERSLAALLIRRNAKEIQAFLREKERTGLERLSSRLSKALIRFTESPRGVWFDEASAHLRYPNALPTASARPRPRPRVTRWRETLAVLLLASGVAALSVWLGWRLARTALPMFDAHATRIIPP